MNRKKMIAKLQDMNMNLMPLRPMAKEPMSDKWKRLQTEKYTGDFPDTCNLAIITGAISGNLFVVDMDDVSLFHDFKEYHDKTFTVKTGRGYHFYFRTSGFLPPNKKFDDVRGRHVDIKSEGGYVLAPSSIHPDTKKEYVILYDRPVMIVNPQEIKDKLIALGFNAQGQTIDELEKNGALEGTRNDSMFKYACYLVRKENLYGTPLEQKMNEVNAKNQPPLPESEIRIIINQALKYEGKNIEPSKEIINIENLKEDIIEFQKQTDSNTLNVKDVYPHYVKQLGEEAVKQIITENCSRKIEFTNEKTIPKISMQDIDPKLHEGVEICFDGTIMAVGERQTYTEEADCECSGCGKNKHVYCNQYHELKIPYCPKCKIKFEIVENTNKTKYIQPLRIQEFLENSRDNHPVEFDAEITDENVGEAFMNTRMTFVAKFRSIPPKDGIGKNNIVFEVLSMKPLEQQKGCMPTEEEIKSWKDDKDIYSKVVSSIAPEIYFDNRKIVESLMLAMTGGSSLNGKRALIHVGLIGDAQLGKSELLEAVHKIIPGSGYTVGNQTTGPGLTIGMHTMYNGTKVAMAGFFPSHDNGLVIIDEADKMKQQDQDYGLQCMEQQQVSQAKTGSGGGMTMNARCTVLIGGNPKNGKFNSKLPVLDNFVFSAPFLSRLDILWLMIDGNDETHDEKVRKHIREFKNNVDKYMKLDELQRFFTYTKTLKVTMSEEFECKIDELHKKMRPLNKLMNGVPIGWRQFYGLNRLITACAANHLRTEVTEEDFKIVESIIKESLLSLKMDIDNPEREPNWQKEKTNQDTVFLETWEEYKDEENTVDKDEFLGKLAGKSPHFNHIKSEPYWNKMERAGRVINNNDGRFRLV